MSQLSIPVGHLLTIANSDSSYRNIQRIGSGGNCEVYLVVGVSGAQAGALVALKLFVKTDESTRLARFQTECEVLRHLTHPAILKVYDSGVVRVPSSTGVQELSCLVASYWPSTLHEVRYRGARLLHKVLYAVQLVSALKYLDAQRPSIVHRDIKPKNVLVNGVTCALADFGLMKRLDTVEEGDVRGLLRSSLDVNPTRNYKSQDLVEYARGATAIDTRSDLFQLGLVLAELFTGVNPLVQGQPLDDVELRPLATQGLGSRQGRRIAQALERMLVIQPGSRESVADIFETWEGIFQSVAQDHHDLEGFVV